MSQSKPMNHQADNDQNLYRITFATLLGGMALAIWLVLRLALLFVTGPEQMGVWQGLKAFGLGVWFDIATLAFLLPPFLVMQALTPSRWRNSNAYGKTYWLLSPIWPCSYPMKTRCCFIGA